MALFDHDIDTLTVLHHRAPQCAWSLAIRAYHQALGYMDGVTLAEVPGNELRTIMRLPAIVRACERLYTTAQSGDEIGTKTTANALNKLLKNALVRLRMAEESA